MKRWFLAIALAFASQSMADDLSTELKTLNLQVEHQFSRDTARTRITQLLQYWGERFGVQSRWVGDRVRLSGQIFGMTIDAAFDVTDHNVVAVARDPGFIWRGQTENYVERKLKKYLHPEYAEL